MVCVVSLGVGLTTLVIGAIATGELGIADSSRMIARPVVGMARPALWRRLAFVAPIAGSRLGAGTFVGLFITASSVMSVIFDHFGWLGFTEHPVGFGRVLGCALMVIGIGFISPFSHQTIREHAVRAYCFSST